MKAIPVEKLVMDCGQVGAHARSFAFGDRAVGDTPRAR